MCMWILSKVIISSSPFCVVVSPTKISNDSCLAQKKERKNNILLNSQRLSWQQTKKRKQRNDEVVVRRRKGGGRESDQNRKRSLRATTMSFWNNPTSKDAFVLSWVSVVLTSMAAIAGLVFFKATGSALCLVFGLENCVDFLSSVVVLWRFYCPGGMSKEREELLQKREKRASMAISFILMLLGLGVIAGSADDLAKGAENTSELRDVLVIAFFSIIVFGSLAVLKFHYANRLDSDSLYKDGLCSMIGTVLAAALFINTLIIEEVPSLWWLDPAIAMICGFVALGLGFHAIIVASLIEMLPIFSLSWWLVSQGDRSDVMDAEAADTDGQGGTQSDLELAETTANGGKASAGSPKLSEVV